MEQHDGRTVLARQPLDDFLMQLALAPASRSHFRRST
jgi:hypothetical protein